MPGIFGTWREAVGGAVESTMSENLPLDLESAQQKWNRDLAAELRDQEEKILKEVGENCRVWDVLEDEDSKLRLEELGSKPDAKAASAPLNAFSVQPILAMQIDRQPLPGVPGGQFEASDIKTYLKYAEYRVRRGFHGSLLCEMLPDSEQGASCKEEFGNIDIPVIGPGGQVRLRTRPDFDEKQDAGLGLGPVYRAEVTWRPVVVPKAGVHDQPDLPPVALELSAQERALLRDTQVMSFDDAREAAFSGLGDARKQYREEPRWWTWGYWEEGRDCSQRFLRIVYEFEFPPKGGDLDSVYPPVTVIQPAQAGDSDLFGCANNQ